ncbi:sulfurtransferase [Pseudomonadota bacterium]
MFNIFKPTLLHRGRTGMWLLLAGFAITATGCGTENDLASSSSTVSKPADIVQASADNYDDNVNGLITGNTLDSWLTDWEANRPAGITGKLVILQTSAGGAGFEYIKPDGTNVFTFSVDSSEWVETRSNGVTETVSMVPSGRAMDTFLAKYGIDPAEDMIVCAQGAAGAGQSMRAGRCWYMFRYWGTPKEHLAVLNGGNDWNGTGTNSTLEGNDFTDTASVPPMNGTASVKDLPEINMALQATLEDMHNIVPAQDINLLGDGIFIWDARGNTFPASDPGSSSDEYSPDDDSDFRNSGATQGHPNGALLLSYSNLLNSAEGYTFKTKAEIQTYLDGDVDGGGTGFVGADLQPVGLGAGYQEGDVVYTYCETTFRAMVTGIASGVIMGLPTRFYDGAMTEWHSMANEVASDGNPVLPWDSQWRTDKSTVSMFLTNTDPANVAPRNIVDAYASSANAVIIEDLAYKGYVVETTTTADSSDGTGSSGGGGALPPNPCGG